MKKSKTHRIHYLLLVYIVLQSIWWMYSIYDLSLQLYPAEKMAAKKWMIFGEGAVFLLILLLSFIFALKTLRKELQLSSQQKNFLMAVTHELKTPISSIKLYLQTLLKRDLEKEKQKEILQKSIQDTDRLNSLVESILLATKIEDHSLPIHEEPTNLSEFVEKTCLKILEGNHKPMDFEFLIGPDIHRNIDRDVWTSIINNLVENAIKYSPEKSPVTIYLNSSGNALVFSVSDQGQGIPGQEKEKIFEKFYRIGNEQTRIEKGTGLGLFIVKHLVELSGGEINVKNNSPKGAIFACTFLNQ